MRVSCAKLIVFVLLVCCGFLSAADCDPRKEDAAYLYETLSKNHIDFFNSVDRSAADEFFNGILAETSSMDEGGFYYDLLSIAALAGDSHTSIAMDGNTVSNFDFLPVVFDVFDDRLFIVAAVDGYENLLGKEVRTICGCTLDEILMRSRTIVPHDNDVYLLSQIKNTHLLIVQFLEAIGIIEPGAVPVAELADGSSVLLARIGYEDYANGKRTLLMRKQPETLNAFSYYSAMYLPDDTALLVNYHACAEMSSLPFTDFAEACLALVEKEGYRKVLIDLRYNSGGDSRIITPLVDGLEKISEERDLDVFVLIGEGTFSSAILNALELKERLGAVFVGRPTGGNASHYGELGMDRLPNSGFAFTWSTKYFDNGIYGPLVPDIAVERNIDDYRNGIDSDLEALGVI